MKILKTLLNLCVSEEIPKVVKKYKEIYQTFQQHMQRYISSLYTTTRFRSLLYRR